MYFMFQYSSNPLFPARWDRLHGFWCWSHCTLALHQCNSTDHSRISPNLCWCMQNIKIGLLVCVNCNEKENHRRASWLQALESDLPRFITQMEVRRVSYYHFHYDIQCAKYHPSKEHFLPKNNVSANCQHMKCSSVTVAHPITCLLLYWIRCQSIKITCLLPTCSMFNSSLSYYRTSYLSYKEIA